MLKTSFVPLGREQFKQLRLAKKMVKDEFGEELVLHDERVLEKLYKYALNSENEELFNLFKELHKEQNEIDQSVQGVTPIKRKATQKDTSKGADIKVGDVVDGKKCTGFYRGQPVFTDLK